MLNLNFDCVSKLFECLSIVEHAAIFNVSTELRIKTKDIYNNKTIKLSAEFMEYQIKNPKICKNFLKGINLKGVEFTPKEIEHFYLLPELQLNKLNKFSFSLLDIRQHERYLFTELKDFLENHCKSLEELELHSIKRQDFETLNCLHFPKLKKLNVSIDNENSELSNGIILGNFPHVGTISLDADFDGLDLCKLKNLQELTLRNGKSLKAEALKSVFTTLKLRKLTIICIDRDIDSNCNDEIMFETLQSISECQTIEELCVDYHYLCMFCNQLPHLKNLRKLTFLPSTQCWCDCSEKNLWADISNHFSQVIKTVKIKSFQFDDEWDALFSFVQSLTNIKCFKIFDNCCNGDDIAQFSKILGKKLREFHIKGFLEWRSIWERDQSNFNGLLHVLKNCTNLDILDLGDTRCNEFFLNAAADTIAGNFDKKRFRSLNMRFDSKVILWHKLKKAKFPEFVKFSSNANKDDNSMKGIQCEW